MVEQQREPPMRSPVSWALLGLVIEHPSHPYELARRFERRYAGVLSLSSVRHAYTALSTLRRRGLIEQSSPGSSGRQARYHATREGVERYRAWLVEQVAEDRRQHELFLLQLAAFAREPAQMLEILERYEQGWLRHGMSTAIAEGAGGDERGRLELLAQLLSEEQRLAVGAKLEWVEYAREELGKLPEEDEESGDARKPGPKKGGA